MATIYKITNNINNFCYIGKTIRPAEIRWQEHLRDYKKYKEKYNCSIPLYNAMNKYGINNFTFKIIEKDIPNDKIDEKEKYYIKYYNAKINQNGYNIADGGNGGRVQSKLSQEDVKNIIIELKNENNIQSAEQIGRKYHISKDVINSINRGDSWYQENIDYPIRKYDIKGLTISKKQYNNIVKDIKQSSLLLKDIRKKYNLSEEQMSSINNGKYCYNGTHPYYKEIYSGPFPIRPNNISKKIINENYFIPIFYEVLFTNDSMAKIGNKYNIQGPTLQGIISGKRRKELTKNYVLPMRKNIQKNQEIFLKLYPQFRGGEEKCTQQD